MHISLLLFLLPLLPPSAAAPTIPEIAQSISHGARSALRHTHALITTGSLRVIPQTGPKQGMRRQRRSCVARGAGAQSPFNTQGNGTSPASSDPSSTSTKGSSSHSSQSGSSSRSTAAPETSSTSTGSPPAAVSPPPSSVEPAPTSSYVDPQPAASTTSAAPAANPSTWNLVQSYYGTTFFNGWDFWDEADPTHGSVTYVSQSAAQSLNLITASSSSAIMRVSTAQPLPSGYTTRPSVRISTQRTFTGGILVADIAHMPTGCGTWPAFWANGPNWPAGGEIDIIEGVADGTQNTASIHTNPGCSIPTDYGASGVLALGGSEGYDCSAEETNDSGCGMTDSTANNYGAPFNNNGGGVYAMKWDSTGISVNFWPRPSIPSDISAQQPDPSTWPEPEGRWPATDCNPFEFFYNNVAIFDTTLCGDWAGNAWSSPAAGASQSCAASTGYSTCEAYVAAEGGNFGEAYWEVYSVVLYQQAGMGS